MTGGHSAHALKVVSLFLILLCSNGMVTEVLSQEIDYKDALHKAILFLEAQRSGKIPTGQRIRWRGDSAMLDGAQENVDLVGGYYDAGDNVKYTLPLAFTVTTLSWSSIHYAKPMRLAGEKPYVRRAIKWGTDFLLKATSNMDRMYAQIGDPQTDHNCWKRPEEITGPRKLYIMDKSNPSTEVVGEVVAALASSYIKFRKVNPPYAKRLLKRAKKLYIYAMENQQSIKNCDMYCSYSGFQDELLWASAWMHRATLDPIYLNYTSILKSSPSVEEFSWDLKWAGAQVLLSHVYFKTQRLDLLRYFEAAQGYVCYLLKTSPTRSAKYTPGGMLFVRFGANTQYVTSASMLFSLFSDILEAYNQNVTCGFNNNVRNYTASDLMDYAKEQMDYVLGKNPKGQSYMVGYGAKYPSQPHHRAASMPALSKSLMSTKGLFNKVTKAIKCGQRFVEWYAKHSPNPNQLTGAIVGGPNQWDEFHDVRDESPFTEPTTYINSCAIGALSKLMAMNQRL